MEYMTKTALPYQPSCQDETYYEKGNLFYSQGQWKEAMECYMEAIHLNPQSPAKYSLKMVENILGFYNKDIYGQ